MPPRRRSSGNRATPPRGYARLEQKLVLLAWLHWQLGYENTADLLNGMKEADEGFGEEHSHVYGRLSSQASRLQGVTTDDLQRYDDNIRKHLVAMNDGRVEHITLRYFQYLAALYTEIYLDRYCANAGALLRSLNAFVVQHNANCTPDARYADFAGSDLGKLAFWMATGSGKTLLLHLNYRQFLHYNRRYNRSPLDNILLVTPNEGLTKQHIEDLEASNIRAERFNLNERGDRLDEADIIKVIEITKLVEEKTGDGASVPVEAFEGNNLIFVDEGHKGTGSEAQKWLRVRRVLGAAGFTFEYSATFGQALGAANNEALLTEYGKAIAFDYSYRYFYNDGYGKDFEILNLTDDSIPDWTDTLLLANLLSFYQKQAVFADQAVALLPYNVERPLWAFVGHTVQGRRNGNEYRSDVLTVARFLHRVLSDPTWATDSIGRLLRGESGLQHPDTGTDVFAGTFDYLQRRSQNAADLYQDVLYRVMHANNAGGLIICDLRGSEGELGLKASSSDDYFGVINIGDTAAFKQLVEAGSTGIVIENDALTGSLFDRVNEPNSTVEVLVGSRKFIEGWNSWRVSNMGLLNIGRGEGSQIIQLFGRGVRLRGRGMSLKRSSAFLGEQHPDYIRLLETLNIFAVRANYMEDFRNYLESEGINTNNPMELTLVIQPNQDFLEKGLVIPRLDEGRDFVIEETVLLRRSDVVRTPVSVIMSAMVQQTSSQQMNREQHETIVPTVAAAGGERQIPPSSLNLIDWNQIYVDLLEYKATKGFSNLLIRPGDLRGMLEANQPIYRLTAEESVVRPQTPAQRERLQETVTNILRKYADVLYRHLKAQWETGHLTYKKLDETDENFRFNIGEAGKSGNYVVRIPRNDAALMEDIQQLIADCNALYNEDKGALPRIHFDRHLYQPLLVQRDGITSSPPGLNEGERRFVADLRGYCANVPDALPHDAELFLLRNLGRGKGVGFFESSGFYPDFILWLKSDEVQRIVFVEPHGMLNANAYTHDEKAKLHEYLPGIASQIAGRSDLANVQLDSFIVSATPYDELYKRYGEGQWSRDDFAEKHILFPDNKFDYLTQIFGY